MGRGSEGPARRLGPPARRNRGPARSSAAGRHDHRARGGTADRPSRPPRREGPPGAPAARSPRLASRPPARPTPPARSKRSFVPETFPRPPDSGGSGGGGAGVLSARARPATTAGLDAATLARLLFFTAGVTRTSA